jgi:hypothetical protein
VKAAPTTRPVRRLDEVRAAKRPILRYAFGASPADEAAPEPDASVARAAGET